MRSYTKAFAVVFMACSSPVLGQSSTVPIDKAPPCCQNAKASVKSPGWVEAEVSSRERIDVTPYLYAMTIDENTEVREINSIKDVPIVASCIEKLQSGASYGDAKLDPLEEQFQLPVKFLPRLAFNYLTQVNRCLRKEGASTLLAPKPKEQSLDFIRALYSMRPQ